MNAKALSIMRCQDDINTEHNMKSIGRVAVAQWTKRLARNGQTRVVLTVPTVINLFKFCIDFTDTWCTVLKIYRVLAINVKFRCCIVDTYRYCIFRSYLNTRILFWYSIVYSLYTISGSCYSWQSHLASGHSATRNSPIHKLPFSDSGKPLAKR